MRRFASRPALSWLLAALLVACGDSTSDAPADGGGGATSGGAPEGGAASGGAPTGGSPTAGSSEGGSATGGAPQGGSEEGGAATGGSGGGPALDGYGALTGTCGEIDLEDILSEVPDYLTGELDFTMSPTFQVSELSAGGQEMYADGNLGGSSLYSEIFAYEVLYRCEGAAYLKSEAEIIYQTEGKKTDILLGIDGEKVGVSVVRAMSFPEGAPYPVSQAYDVLFGKLDDITKSSMNVAPEDAWKKQILSVIAQTDEHAAAIAEAYAMVPAETKADTIVVVTVTEGEDDFIYYNQ
jgi:hypothetical protein